MRFFFFSCLLTQQKQQEKETAKQNKINIFLDNCAQFL